MNERMLDDIDKQILTIIQKNGRTSNADIARGLKMAPSGILERIRSSKSAASFRGMRPA